jgi:hypothetical protein
MDQNKQGDLDVCVGDLDVYKIQMGNCSLDAGFPFL